MRSAPVLAAVAFGAVAVISGCGQQYPGPPQAGAPSPPPAGASSLPSASSPPPPPPGTRHAGTCPSGPAPRRGVITLTNADNGRSVCVRRGTAVLVYLRGTQASRWSVIHTSPGVLQPHANGHGLLPLGVTGASFVAARPGTASITSTRMACPTPPPNSGSQSGTVECVAILAFRVSVRVS